MISLRRKTYFSLLVLALLLALVVLLGLRQYQLAGRYDQVIVQSEKVMFRALTIREHIIEALVTKDWSRIILAAAGLEQLNADLSALLDNGLIPGEYKLALLDKVDLVAVGLLARKVAVAESKDGLAAELFHRIRDLDGQLRRFDRVIVGQMKDRLVRFQGLMIGLLTGMVGLVSLVLLLIYQKTVLPLGCLRDQIVSCGEKFAGGFESGEDSCLELVEICQGVNHLLAGDDEGPVAEGRVNTVRNRANGIINYAQLLYDEGREGNMAADKLAILRNIIDSGEQIAVILRQQQRERE